MRTLCVVGSVAVAQADHLADRFGDAGLATAAVGIGAVVARAWGLPLACPLHALTGIPCPGCGMTRLADAVVRADPQGVAVDPLGVVVMAVIGALAVVGVAGRLGVAVRLPAAARAIPAVLLALSLARWALVLSGVGPDVG